MQYGILDELDARGLVYQATDREGLREHLTAPRAVYCGYDPTAPSLQVGNLVPVLVQARLQQAGHTPVVVLGGATGQIGDPSGKSSERPLLDLAVIEENKRRQRAIFERLLRFGHSGESRVLYTCSRVRFDLAQFAAVEFAASVRFGFDHFLKLETVMQSIAWEPRPSPIRSL